jgi:hypothetical protein
MFRQLNLFPSSHEETPTLLGHLERTNLSQRLRLVPSKGPNGAGVSVLSHEEVNRYSFRNVVFSSYLEFRIMDKVHIPRVSVLYVIVRTL